MVKEITDEQFAKLRAGIHRYTDKGKIFHMAIIDYLQQYNCTKSVEHVCVPLCKNAKKETISVAKPPFYGARF